MQILISALRAGNNQVKETVEAPDLPEELEFRFEPLNLTGEIDNYWPRLDVRLNVQTRGYFICDRCAIEYDTEINIPVRLQVLGKDVPDDADLDQEGLIYVDPRAVEVDITDELVSSILLEIPMKKLCIEDCKGLCFNCGVDLNEESCKCENKISNE